MMKESYWFPHDYGASSDPKMSALIEEYKAEGYGIYWHIIEILHQEEGHKLPLKQYVYIAIAKQMKASAEQIENIVKHCILVCELFIVDGDFFYSPRVMRNFEKRAEISEKRSIAGKYGAIAKQNLAIAKQNLANTSKEKDIKRKKRIIKETKIFIPPSFEEFKKYCKDEGFENIAERAFKGYFEADWHDAKGDKIYVWKSKLQNGWFTEKNKDKNQQQNLFNGQPTKKEYPMKDAMWSKLVRLIGSPNHPDMPDYNDEAAIRRLYDDKVKM